MMKMVDKVRLLTRTVDVPVIADADTGYGNEVNATRTIQDTSGPARPGCISRNRSRRSVAATWTASSPPARPRTRSRLRTAAA